MHGNANTHEVDFVAGAPGLMQQCVDENNSIEVCTCCSRLCSRSSITVLGLHEVRLELVSQPERARGRLDRGPEAARRVLVAEDLATVHAGRTGPPPRGLCPLEPV